MKRLATVAALAIVLAVGVTGCAPYGDCQQWFIHENTTENPYPPELGYCRTGRGWGYWWHHGDSAVFGVSKYCVNSPIFGNTECADQYPGPGPGRRSADPSRAR
jgi:hypothetical protein